MSSQALLWRALPDKHAQCLLCRHFCRLRAGEWGICGVRGCKAAKDGHPEIFTLVDRRAAALHADPIEKKPLYHYLPGSLTLSLGTFGCNFDCAWCQNCEISRPPIFAQHQFQPADLEQRTALCRRGTEISPDGLVRTARELGCSSIAFTYTEECSRVAGFIHDRLGADTPWHISAFFPSRFMSGTPSTPQELLEHAREIGIRAGLHHVYVGNVKNGGNHTSCPACGETAVRREGFRVSVLSPKGICPRCGLRLSGIWQGHSARSNGETL